MDLSEPRGLGEVPPAGGPSASYRKSLCSMAGRHGINMRIGAYMQAIERVAAVHRLRGMYA